jgi:hypothetical protein
MRAALALLLLACIASASAAQPLEDFGYAAPIETAAGEALQRIEIPQAVYEGSVQPHLADLRVFNGQGEMVPFAFVPRQVPGEAKSPGLALRFFPLHGARAASVQDLEVRAERTADGTLVRVRNLREGARNRQALLGYLVDAAEHETALETLELDWKPIANGLSGSLQVEGSDDLARWSTLVAAAPLVSLEFGGQRLEQKSVELPGRRYRYLRLSWPAAQPRPRSSPSGAGRRCRPPQVRNRASTCSTPADGCRSTACASSCPNPTRWSRWKCSRATESRTRGEPWRARWSIA